MHSQAPQVGTRRTAGAALLHTSSLPFNNVKIELSDSDAPDSSFAAKLGIAVEEAGRNQKKAIWLHLEGHEQCKHIPDALLKGFEFHHALGNKAVMTQWLDNSMPNKIPPYATHQVGCAGFTTRWSPSTGRREVLLVKEARSIEAWKLPGGIADKGEEFGEAAVREVMEETGVEAKYMKRVFSMRNSHGLAHGKSDLYVVVHLEAEGNGDIKIDENEIQAAAWHDLEEVATWTKHPINRECLRALGVDIPAVVDEDDPEDPRGERDGHKILQDKTIPSVGIREITTRLSPDRRPFKLYLP